MTNFRPLRKFFDYLSQMRRHKDANRHVIPADDHFDHVQSASCLCQPNISRDLHEVKIVTHRLMKERLQ